MTKLSPNVLIYLALVCMGLDPSYGQSLARNKTVTHSELSSIAGWADELGVVDGNYSRNASGCRCCADSGRGVDPWIEIDLGEPNSFTRIVVYGRTDFDNDVNKLANVTVELDGDHVSVSPTSYSSDPYLLHMNFERTMMAQRIKLISRGNDKRLILCEVDVFSDSIISTRKNVTAVSIYDKWQPSNAVDGLISTNQPDECLCCAATERQTNPWLRLDLGDVFFITFIQLYGRTDGSHNGQSFGGMRIDVDDTTIHTIPASGTNINYYELFPTPESFGRYIKLTLSGDDKVLTICELVVYGERVISTKKGATQISKFASWEASRAVDGNYVTDNPDGCKCCSATKHETNPSLEVDLGPNHKISRLVIYGRTDDEYPGQTFVDLKIEVDSATLQTIPEPDPVYWVNFFGFQLSSALIGQIVNLTLIGPDEQLVVCELVVYGDCVDGYFGEECDKQCHCKGELCNNLTGICPTGICEPGYKGKTCSERCDANSYGQNCSETCGECKNNEVCNFITGFCNDCEDGYILTDKTCKSNCTTGRYGNNCSESCGQCRDGETCNITTGKCDKCADGLKFTDLFCKTVCDNGTYGYNCTRKCGNCRNEEFCDKVDGRCTECEDGYTETDPTCKTKCRNGTYGQNCADKCGACKESAPCNVVNGTCEDCSDGYNLTDKLCKTGCASHTYGYNCSSQCGQCRDALPCDLVTGECEKCDAGYNYTDRLCNTTCDEGFHGLDCLTTCGQCFGDEVCNHVNGSCFKCSEGFTGTTCTESIYSPPIDSVSVGPIVGGVVGAIVVAALVIVAVIIIRKRRQISKPVNNSRPLKLEKTRKPSAKQENLYANNGIFDDARLIHSEVNETLKSTHDKADVENEYYNLTSTTTGILIHDLWEYTRKNKVNKGEGFGIEFKKLKDGLIFAHNDALANRKKNRYKEMFPYDHSRVHLKVEKEGESEFINASHIDGFDETRKFIASQGPIKVMVDDFWRMVWQQNSTIIVMLTNLIETGNHKCMQYWPDEGSVNFARITITMIQEKDMSDYCVRTLEIQEDGGIPRRIRQFHFKAWPDKDVPDSTWSLTQFWRDIFKDNNTDIGPIVVHCSAGVGRTGTFIALDNLYHQATRTGKVTPFSVVETLRNQRVKMVQTSNQYTYLHEALADLMLFGTHYLWLSQFPEYYDFMIKKDKDKGKLRLRVQYEYLEKSLGNVKYKDGSQAAAGNTVKEIDEYRPKSATSVEAEKLRTIPLPGLNGPDSFILTTLPDDKSIRECWKLIEDHNVETVITLTDATKESYESIWTAIDGKGCGTYNPVLTMDKRIGPLRKRQFTYTCTRQTEAKGEKSKASLTQIEVAFSCKSEAETQAEPIMKLLEVVSSWQPYISTSAPVIIQCEDGVSDSGVLSVLLNEKQRILKEGGQINILESVMMARRANKSCISSYNQYRFIHDIMIHAVETKEPVSAEEEAEDLNIYQNL